MKTGLATCLAAVTMLTAAAGIASADKLSEIKERGTLVCGTQSTSVPYAFQDPQTRTFVGYDVDMCNALAKGLGVKLEHRALSTEARIPELKLGRVDLVAGGMAYLPERAQQVDYSNQYLRTEIKVMVKESSGIKTLADLAGKRVCSSKGSAAAAIAERVLPDSRVASFQDVAACNLALGSDKVEGFSAGELVLLRFADEAAKTDQPYFLIKEPTAVEHIGIVTDKGNPELIAAVNDVIAEMDKSGELDTIFNRWLGKDTTYGLTRGFKVESVDKAQ